MMSQPATLPSDVQRRIERLQEKIREYPQQKQNISAIIEFYRRGGSLPSAGHVVYSHNGNSGRGTVDEVAGLLQARSNGSVPFFDMAGQQLSNHSYHLPDNGAPFRNINPRLLQTRGHQTAVQMAEHATCQWDSGSQMHKIWAQFRLPRCMGGSDDPHIITHEILNDTGSSVQVVYRHDWDLMNTHKWTPSTMEVTYASGNKVYIDSFIGQIRIVKFEPTTGDMKALTGWLNETFVIKDPDYHGQVQLLSGNAMRQVLYFATAPGNDQLYVSVKKNGLMAHLPAV